jgi:hypothetical protein
MEISSVVWLQPEDGTSSVVWLQPQDRTSSITTYFDVSFNILLEQFNCAFSWINKGLDNKKSFFKLSIDEAEMGNV